MMKLINFFEGSLSGERPLRSAGWRVPALPPVGSARHTACVLMPSATDIREGSQHCPDEDA
jgi:hypothetical protein